MKNIKLNSLLLLISSSLFAGKLIALELKSELQNNYFCADNQGVLEFTLDENSGYTITDKQPYNGVWKANDPKYSGCINVLAGRKADDGRNLTWVKLKYHNQLHIPWEKEYMTNTSKHKSYKEPQSLNFAIYGTLKYEGDGKNVICENVIIGQEGGANFHNIWWISNNTMEKAHYLKCVDEFQKEVFLSLEPGKDSYRIKFSFDQE